jgi:uncharacterized membrane protein YphA (DoxX/SURF4 family)
MVVVAPAPLSQRLLFVIRMVLAATWLYQGLWLKLIKVDPHHLAVVEAVGSVGGMSPRTFLMLVGSGETLLGIGAASGILWRFVTGFQIGLLVLMNSIGILSGGVPNAAGLIVGNLPLLMCMIVVWNCGPGRLRE